MNKESKHNDQLGALPISVKTTKVMLSVGLPAHPRYYVKWTFTCDSTITGRVIRQTKRQTPLQ